MISRVGDKGVNAVFVTRFVSLNGPERSRALVISVEPFSRWVCFLMTELGRVGASARPRSFNVEPPQSPHDTFYGNETHNSGTDSALDDHAQ